MNLKLYQNRKAGFQIQIPQKWELDAKPPANNEWTFRRPGELQMHYINVSVSKNGNSQTIGELKSELEKKGGLTHDFKDVKAEAYVGFQYIEDFKGTILVTLRNDNIWQVTDSTSGNNTLASFKFID